METCLGVLCGKGCDVPDRAEPALRLLANAGLTMSSDEIVGALRLALMHRTFLYENQELIPGVDPKHLDTLALVGSIYQRRSVGFHAYTRLGMRTNTLLAQEMNRASVILPDWANETDWLRSSTLLGKGLSKSLRDGDIPKSVLAGVFHQLLGLLCLMDEHAVADVLLENLLSRVMSDPNPVDPKTTLSSALPGDYPRFEYTHAGPDHARRFYAVATDGMGRSGKGEGHNKTTASQAAALNFLRSHGLDQLLDRVPPEERRPPEPITKSRTHTEQVIRLQELFELPESARGLLSQALIHKSWVYENTKVVRLAAQQDNDALAILGAEAVRYEHTLAAARSTIRTEYVDDQTNATPENSTYAEAFQRTGCAAGFLLSVGLRRQAELSTAIASNAFQALFAAVAIAHGVPATIENRWPESWQSIWDLIAPGCWRAESPHARLSSLSDTILLPSTTQTVATGPAHDQRFRATIELDSAALGRLVTLTGSYQRSNAAARADAARTLIDIIDELAADIPDDKRIPEGRLPQFLVAHLACVFVAQPHVHRNWARKRLLGLHLIPTADRLLEWARAVDQLAGDDLGPCSSQCLVDAYTAVMSETSTTMDVRIEDLSPMPLT